MALVKSHIFTTIRGVTGDLEFRLRKNRKTDLSKKRFPSNPRTEAQQAVRLCYGKGVQAYNQLTPAELDYWNEIGKGYSPPLDAYRAFMKDFIPTCLGPSEQTEEQTQHNDDIVVGYPDYEKSGQRLTIPNRKITKLAFLMKKWGNPTGSLYFEIRRITPDELIYNQLVGDASSLPETPEWIEKALDTPPTINEEVRILAHITDGTDANHGRMRAMDEDVKANEILTRWHTNFWDETLTYDCAYRYKYYEA